MNTHDPLEYRQRFQDELSLIRSAQAGCPQAIAELVTLTLPLRRSLAYRFLPNSPSLQEDALQVGWLGALRALEKWNESKQVCFTDWCRFDVSWAIRDFKYKMEKAVARPHWIYRKLNQINSCQTEDLQELSDLMSCPTRQVEIIRGARSGDVSLSPGETGFEDHLLLIHQLISESNPAEELSKSELINLLLKEIRQLSPRESLVLNLRYGLGGEDPVTHSEIGEVLHLTRQRVEQIESEILKKLRAFFRKIDKDLHPPDSNNHARFRNKRRNFYRRKKPIQTDCIPDPLLD